MFPRSLIIVGLFALAAACEADVVKLVGRAAFERVHVIGLSDDSLEFRGLSGQTLRKPLPQVEWLELERSPDLSRAERAAAGRRWGEAAQGYRAALDSISDRPVRDFASLRLLTALQEARRFDEAIRVYLELLRERPRLARSRVPPRPAPDWNDRNSLCLKMLDGVRAARPDGEFGRVVQELWLELVLLRDADELPAEVAERLAAQAADIGLGWVVASEPAATSRPARRGSALLPEDAVTADDWRLPAESCLLAASRDALRAGAPAKARRLAGRALPFVRPEEAAVYRVVLARSLIELDQPDQAVELLAATTARSDDAATAADVLYYLGLAHERAGRAEAARDSLRRALIVQGAPEATRQLARDALRRLGE